MTNEERLIRLEEQVKTLEQDLNMVYDSLDKRLDDMRLERSDRITICGIIVAIVIGTIQIIIALVK